MNLLILTAITVIGIIGVIGTVEYSHAQTPLTLNPLPNTPEPDDIGIAIQTASNTSKSKLPEFWFLTTRPNNTILIGDTRTGTGHIFIPGPNNEILKNPSILDPAIPKRTSTIHYCELSAESVKHLLDPTNTENVRNLKIPSNIKEQSNDTIIAAGFDWTPSRPDDTFKCPTGVDLEAPAKHPLITKSEFIYTLYSQSNKKAYYFSPRENIMEAQPIPLCTTETIDTTKLTLKGDTKMCYGKHGDNMVIITKKFTGFYGATESITTPTKQYALDSDRNDTLDYLNLLKKLYLPAV